MSEQYISEKLITIRESMPQMNESDQAKAMDILAEFDTACLCGADDDTKADYKQRIDYAIGQIAYDFPS